MVEVNADISTEESATGLVNQFLNLQLFDSRKFFNYNKKHFHYKNLFYILTFG